MKGVTFTHRGNFSKTDKFLNKLSKNDAQRLLDEYGRRGVEALSAATPIDSGNTAKSWSYEVDKSGNGYAIKFFNDSKNEGISIVILNQYGHATRSGSWVQGRDFINPAIRPVFDTMAKDLWKEMVE